MLNAGRIVVVGNGVVGLMTAWRARTRFPDVEVTVVGPSNRDGAASTAAGAMLGVFGEITKYSFATEPASEKFSLGLAARRAWPQLLQQLEKNTERPLQVAGETYVVLNGRSGQLDTENFKALQGALLTHKEPYEEVDIVPGLHPVPDARPLRAIRLTSEPAVDAVRTVTALHDIVQASGGRTVDGMVNSISTSGGRVSEVGLLDGSKIAADAVVIAAGAYSSPLLRQALGPNAIMPILSGSGVALVTRRVMGEGFNSVVRSVNRAGSCGLHIIPLGHSQEYLGATNVIFARPETQPHLGVWQFLITSARDQLDQRLTYSRVHEARIGNRPVTLDTFPVLGPTAVDGLLVLSGTYRDGLTLSPTIADLTVRSLEAGRSAFPGAFAPHRDPHLYHRLSDGIDEFALNCVSSAYEANTHLSPFIDSAELADLFRPRALALHARLGLDRALPPDIIGYLTLSRKKDDDVSDVGRFLAARRLVNDAR